MLGGTLEIRPSGDMIIPFLTADVDDVLPELLVDVVGAFVLLFEFGVFEELVEFLLVVGIVDAEAVVVPPFENCPWLV